MGFTNPAFPLSFQRRPSKAFLCASASPWFPIFRRSSKDALQKLFSAPLRLRGSRFSVVLPKTPFKSFSLRLCVSVVSNFPLSFQRRPSKAFLCAAVPQRFPLFRRSSKETFNGSSLRLCASVVPAIPPHLKISSPETRRKSIENRLIAFLCTSASPWFPIFRRSSKQTFRLLFSVPLRLRGSRYSAALPNKPFDCSSPCRCVSVVSNFSPPFNRNRSIGLA